MPLRLTLLGGARGAGRTSWLKPNLEKGPFAGAYLIANHESRAFSELRRLARETAAHRGILEMSPLTDPQRFKQALAEDPELSRSVIIGEVVVVVDASLGAAQLISDRSARLQALGADAIVLTKLDVCAEPELRTLIATSRLINPRAALFGAVRGVESDLPPDGPVRPQLPPDLGEACVGAVLALDEAANWTAFSLWLSALLHARGRDIFRVRAWARTAAGAVLVHGMAGEMFAPEFSHDVVAGGGEAVILGRGFAAQDLARSLSDFAGR